MTDAAAAKSAATAGQSKNSAVPEPEVHATPVAAAPCGCEERVSVLEGRWAAQDSLNKAMTWCLLAVAAAVLYIAWTGAGSGAKDPAAK